jgi:hypothetical protein
MNYSELDKKSKKIVNSVYEQLKNRDIHPAGEFDSGGRYYAHDNLRDCFSARSPSKAWPYSELTACRSRKFVTNVLSKYNIKSEKNLLDVVTTCNISNKMNKYFLEAKAIKDLKDLVEEYLEDKRYDLRGYAMSFIEDEGLTAISRNELEKQLNEKVFGEGDFDNTIGKEAFESVEKEFIDDLRETQHEMVNEQLEIFDKELQKIENKKEVKNRSRRRM